MSENQASGLPLFEQRARRLGRKHNDASPGDHTHNAVNSKKLKVKDGVLSDEFRFFGTVNTDAQGDATLAHGLGAVPTGVIAMYSGTGTRGFITRNGVTTDATNVVVRCFDSANVARASASFDISLICWL